MLSSSGLTYKPNNRGAEILSKACYKFSLQLDRSIAWTILYALPMKLPCLKTSNILGAPRKIQGSSSVSLILLILSLVAWIVNSKSDNFFKGFLAILNRRHIV
jgi:hypothetical protein